MSLLTFTRLQYSTQVLGSIPRQGLWSGFLNLTDKTDTDCQIPQLPHCFTAFLDQEAPLMFLGISEHPPVMLVLNPNICF